MDALRVARFPGRPRCAAAFSAAVLAAAALAAPARADDPVPAASPPAFQPGEISIGEPIALPPGGALANPPAGAPVDDPRSAVPSTAAAAAAPVPGSGWLGLAVAESNVPGRWRIDEVTPGGPAARAGIVAGDELRAVNGVNLASPEEVSQALTAISAGQDVRVAVARADRVSDVVLRAEPRPTPRPAEPSRFATRSPALPAPAAQPPAPLPVPTPQADPPPAATPDWQAARTADPAPAGSRFGSPAGEPAAPTPGPAAPPVVPSAPPRMAGPTVPASPAAPPATPGRLALGVRTVPIDPALQARFKLQEPVGAYVIGVVGDLPAAKAGVPPGSVIVAVGERPVRSPQELTKLVTDGPADRPVTVQFVMPGGESRQAAVVFQPLDAPLERALTGGADAAPQPPTLGPVPRRAERNPGIDDAIRAEIRGLRTRLDRLEQLLQRPASRGP